MKSKIYMAVTADELELPLFVSDDPQELAAKFNVSKNLVLSCISKNTDGTRTGRRFIKVLVDDEE